MRSFMAPLVLLIVLAASVLCALAVAQMVKPLAIIKNAISDIASGSADLTGGFPSARRTR